MKLDRQYTLVTSEDIVPGEMEALLNSQGMATGDSTACAQMVIAYMNSKAKVVGPAKDPRQQQPSQGSSQAARSQVIHVSHTAIDKEEEMTDVECTDSEDEARIANEADDGKRTEIRKKTKNMTRKDKKAKVGAKSDKGK